MNEIEKLKNELRGVFESQTLNLRERLDKQQMVSESANDSDIVVYDFSDIEELKEDSYYDRDK